METTSLFDAYPDVLSAREVQDALKLGRLSTYKLLASGAITCFKIGNTYKIPKTALLSYIDTQCKSEKEETSK